MNQSPSFLALCSSRTLYTLNPVIGQDSVVVYSEVFISSIRAGEGEGKRKEQAIRMLIDRTENPG